MRFTTQLTLALALGGSLVGATPAFAEDNLVEKYGLSLSVGGGVAGFTEEAMRDTTQTAGIWDVRATFGTRFPVALEAGYLGSAQAIDTLGLDDSAILVGTAVEALARVNVVDRGAWQPYLFAGAAWRRYDLANVDTNTSSVLDQDDLLEIPLGLGLGYRYDDFLFDARAQFRAAAEADMIPTGTGDDAERMDTWGVSARLGYEF